MKSRKLSYEDLGDVKLDHQRISRRGFPEVIFCESKSYSQIEKIVDALFKKNLPIILTRLKKEHFVKLKSKFSKLQYSETARMAYANVNFGKKRGIVVVCAGTSDVGVAEEASLTAELMGNSVERFYDVGVAGLHRLLNNIQEIRKARVIIVVAGMDAALPSVVSGLTSVPLIAVPTSVGYGASFKGLSALLSMLNSCSPGIGVVNIDNGFGAGYLASLINKKNMKK